MHRRHSLKPTWRLWVRINYIHYLRSFVPGHVPQVICPRSFAPGYLSPVICPRSFVSGHLSQIICLRSFVSGYLSSPLLPWCQAKRCNIYAIYLSIVILFCLWFFSFPVRSALYGIRFKGSLSSCPNHWRLCWTALSRRVVWWLFHDIASCF